MKKKSKMLPPVYFYSIMFSLIILHFLFPILLIIKPPISYLGVIPIILGISLNIWADQLFKKKQTTVKPYESPSQFIEEGPFKISRHPMYLWHAICFIWHSNFSWFNYYVYISNNFHIVDGNNVYSIRRRKNGRKIQKYIRIL